MLNFRLFFPDFYQPLNPNQKEFTISSNQTPYEDVSETIASGPPAIKDDIYQIKLPAYVRVSSDRSPGDSQPQAV